MFRSAWVPATAPSFLQPDSHIPGICTPSERDSLPHGAAQSIQCRSAPARPARPAMTYIHHRMCNSDTHQHHQSFPEWRHAPVHQSGARSIQLRASCRIRWGNSLVGVVSRAPRAGTEAPSAIAIGNRFDVSIRCSRGGCWWSGATEPLLRYVYGT